MLPISTSIKPFRTPYANYALIVANAIIFALSYHPVVQPYTRVAEPLRPWADLFMLTPARPHLWQFISYAFLHGSFIHIIGNMFFLYLFGNNVNDRLGHIGYICFYLAGAVFSAIGHSFISNMPVIGASGAVAAVTGAYLVLFPQTLITVLFWIFVYYSTVDVPAIYFIAFKLIILDNVLARYTPNVAYNAHLAGYAFGIIVILLMLAARLITPTPFDLWAMIKQWNRRRQYRDVVSAGCDPFTGFVPAKRVSAREVPKSPDLSAVPVADQPIQNEQVRQLRNQITARLSERNLPAAAAVYLQLLALDPAHLLPRQHLLDIANQLASESRHAEAAEAYEKFLAHYAGYEYLEQVQLMLGLIYSRYLNKPDLAAKYLRAALEKLSHAGQLQMCRDELAKLQNR